MSDALIVADTEDTDAESPTEHTMHGGPGIQKLALSTAIQRPRVRKTRLMDTMLI